MRGCQNEWQLLRSPKFAPQNASRAKNLPISAQDGSLCCSLWLLDGFDCLFYCSVRWYSVLESIALASTTAAYIVKPRGQGDRPVSIATWRGGKACQFVQPPQAPGFYRGMTPLSRNSLPELSHA